MNRSTRLYQNRRDILLLLLTTLCVLYAYTDTLSNGFTNWDDTTYILHNPALRDLSGENLRRIFSPAGGMLKAETLYCPATYMTYAIEHFFFGFDPRVFHATSLLLHVANTLLLYAFFMMLTGKRVLALSGTMLFSLHPVQVEAVAWAMGRKDVLACFFSLSCLTGYLGYKRTRNPAVYALSLSAFVLAALSKPSVVVLPLILFLCDFLTGARTGRRSLLEKTPFILIGIAFSLQTVSYVGTATAGIETTLAEKLSMPLYVPWIVFTYLKNVVYPFALAALYPTPPAGSFAGLEIVVPAVLFVSIVVLVAVSLRHTRVPCFGGAVFLVLISPTFVLIPKLNDFLVADHYFYLPSIGVFFLAGAGIDWFYHRYGSGNSGRAASVLSCALVAVFCTVTAAQTRTWRDSVSLWDNQIEKYPDTMPPIAYNNRGIAFKRLGEFSKAVADYSRAIEMFPRYADAYRNRGNVYLTICCDTDDAARRSHWLRRAIDDYSRVLEIDPADTVARIRRREAHGRLRSDGAG